jgi:hypothetical protein
MGDLAERAIKFIREYIEYDKLIGLAQSVHPLHREEITGSPPEFRIFLPGILESEFEKKPLEDIPDSDEYVLVDIGSHLGTRITLPFSRAKPKVQVYMVDCLTRKNIVSDRAYDIFSVRTPISEEDIEGSVNRLLQENGYENVRYIQKKLRFGSSLDLGVEDEIKGKRIVLTGFKNPKGLGNLTIEEAVRLEASRVYLNNSALENIINPKSKHFDWMKEYLSAHLSPFEIWKFIGLMGYGGRRYDYKDEGMRNFALALKLLFVLAQKDKLEKAGYKVKIMRNVKNRDNHFNKPDYNLVASSSKRRIK